MKKNYRSLNIIWNVYHYDKDTGGNQSNRLCVSWSQSLWVSRRHGTTGPRIPEVLLSLHASFPHSPLTGSSTMTLFTWLIFWVPRAKQCIGFASTPHHVNGLTTLVMLASCTFTWLDWWASLSACICMRSLGVFKNASFSPLFSRVTEMSNWISRSVSAVKMLKYD